MACSNHICPVCGKGQLIPLKSYWEIFFGSSQAARIETAAYG